MSAGELFYRVLGEPVAERGGRELPLGPPQARRVFALLLLEAPRPVSRDRIVDELWGDNPPPSARVQVQGLISGLRRALRPAAGDQPIVTRGASYLLEARPEQTDTGRFTELSAEGRELLAAHRFPEAAERFREALALWRGPVLAGVPAAPEVAAYWGDLRLAAVEDRIDADLGRGEHDRLVPELRDLLGAAPYRERACGQLMTALARAGRIAEALEVYRRWRDRLVDELGIDPSPAIRALHEEILRDGAGLAARDYAVRSGNPVPSQLPPGIPDFVGRGDLVAELLAELAPDPARGAPPVLLLTGAGGIGKTSLAVRLAHRVADGYPDGALFAFLRGTTNEPRSPHAVLGGFLRAFGVASDAVPADLDESAGLFRSLVHGRRVLIVLDDAAGEAQLRPLLPAGAGCAVIVTSRFALTGLEQGRCVPVDVLSDADAAALLAPHGDVTSLAAHQVLDYCGGLPLALRIVGSRIGDRSGWRLADVAAELSVERKRLDWLRAGDLAVRSSVALGYRQLAPESRRLFRRLGLLPAADFPAWAAAAVTGGEPGPAEAALEDLRARHMVQPAGRAGRMPRYRVHDLLRSFAIEEVAAEPEHERAAATESALSGWLWLAEEAANRMPHSVLRPPPGNASRRRPFGEVAEPMSWFHTELPALEAAVSRAADAGMGETAWELAVVTSSYFDHSGLYSEWWRCHQRALGAARASGCERGEAALLRGIGQIHLYWDDFPEATRTLEESYRISERIGDPGGMARALTGLCVVSRSTGRPGESRTRAARALEIFTGIGDILGMAHLQTSHAVASIHLGRLDEAEMALDKAWRLCVELDDPHRMALVLRRQGQLQLRRRDPEGAMSCLRRALELLESMADELCAAQVRLDLGRTYTTLGERQAAARALIDASSHFTTAGNRSSAAACAQLLDSLA
ncbi:AfsR/SARP family transcriptional regulator [Amycolatopsis saalfeldensis]|uniref:Pentatricopeptide repeat domain-containing protein (PPR motif) n=1 Tax=Amycolatopsis saalfeldensis TaxID=394193 RepID=A0A1H8XEL5_9PSEU|nr:BTAD domain-containing putative transcriptional regulator [Amycolatopsis saalfeldensis]SEP38293.1 pentatricopeptide repeat domain-containing protein (PPR motif) [Amycolatopsis saalfeldensis]